MTSDSAYVLPEIRLHLDVTSTCNLSCRFCRAQANGKPSLLLTKDYLDLVHQLRRSFCIRSVFIGGCGEPLLWPQWPELVGALRRKMPSLPVTLITNGQLIDESTAGSLRRQDVRVQVSIDATENAVHDWLRGTPGAAARAREALEHLRRAGVTTAVRTVVCNENIDQLPRLYSELVEMAVPMWAVKRLLVPPDSSRTGPASPEVGLPTPPAPGDYLRRLQWLIDIAMDAEAPMSVRVLDPLANAIGVARALRRPASGGGRERIAGSLDAVVAEERCKPYWYHGCEPDVTYLYFAPDGSLLPCPHLPIELGNITRQPVIDILRSSSMIDIVRHRRYREPCGSCRFRWACGGCRAAALLAHGDAQAPDPLCPFSNGDVDEELLAAPTATGTVYDHRPRD